MCVPAGIQHLINDSYGRFMKICNDKILPASFHVTELTQHGRYPVGACIDT